MKIAIAIIVVVVVVTIVVVILAKRRSPDAELTPAKKIMPATQVMPPGEISYSQLDITETFGDNERLKSDEWISTSPLNKMTPKGEASGLPPADATADEVYAVADKMSRIRESISIPNDGVYCPICHIANVQLGKLRSPCPKCGRPLLKFGWD
ncbi:hypothetical protein ETAA8_39360 [Anatilimnocola aggregata]|uniref:Uncharacterized protein n=1 Tax=Anatilimnocola aggregata TaxID=2528021 RepID=A0A517YF49_9BACT|nr:hypothetical protein [Anatilimnocola aggregata]QDU28831.1 hypothetical protein ETAA8_39360 [Anatilimnocola aggregata]